MLDWVDQELLAFVEHYAGQRVQWKVTEYFGRNPQISQSEEAIAHHLGLSATDVNEQLLVLHMHGLLEREKIQDQTFFQLTSDPCLRAMAKRFAKLCDFASRPSYQAVLSPASGNIALANI